MKKLKTILELYFTFCKIGLFTIGGGLAMLPILERELVERKNGLIPTNFTIILQSVSRLLESLQLMLQLSAATKGQVISEESSQLLVS